MNERPPAAGRPPAPSRVEGDRAAAGGRRGAAAGTRFAGPGDSPGFLLWQVTLRWQRAIAAALAPLDLTHVQFVLLAVCWWTGRDGTAPNQLELARTAGTDVKMTSQVLGRLEAKGLVERHPDPADTRAKRLAVTAAGAELAGRAVAAVEDADAAFFGQDAAAATPLLRRLAG